MNMKNLISDLKKSRNAQKCINKKVVLDVINIKIFVQIMCENRKTEIINFITSNSIRNTNEHINRRYYSKTTAIRIIINIIMSCRQHGYPWPSLATSPYHSSPPAGLQGYILCPHIVAVCKFELVVLLLHGHMWGSIGVHHLWARPCFSSSVPRAWFV